MTGLDEVRACMVSTLTAGDVNALTAWPSQGYGGLEVPVVAVSVRSCQDSPGGFLNYLGDWYDAQRDVWQERYGKQVQVEFGLDIYAPAAGGAQACQTVFGQVMTALYEKAPAGLQVEEITRGEVAYDKALRVLACPVTARCRGFLYAWLEESGVFSDFEVKGEQI